MSKVQPNYVLPLVFLVAILLGFALLLIMPASKKENKEEIIPIGGPFELIDNNGVRRTEADFKGQYLLVYFGYTSCPDVCPIALQTMSEAVERLGEKGKLVTPIFITVDPERDTVEQIDLYISDFHPRFVGLTGTPKQTAAAAKAYRVYYAKANEDKDYLTDHTSILFFMGPDGRFLNHFRHGETVEKISQEMSRHLN